MLVVVSVFTLAVGAVSDIFINLYNLSTKTNLEKKVYQDVRYAVETISKEANQAKKIDVDSINKVIQFTQTDDTVHSIKRASFNTSFWKLVLQTPTETSDLTSQSTSIINFDIKNVSTGTCSRPFFELYIKGESVKPVRWGGKPVFEINTIISKQIYTDLKSCPPGGCTTTTFISGAVSSDTSFLISSKNELYAAGRNEAGQLGIADGPGGGSVNAFVKTTLSNVVSVDAVSGHTLAVLKNGSVWARGQDIYGNLGIGVDNYDAMDAWKQAVQSTNGGISLTAVDSAKKVTVADGCSVILKNDGTVWAAGGGTYSATGPFCLGTGGYAYNKFTPYFTKVVTNGSPPFGPTLSNIIDIDANHIRAIALTGDGKVWWTGARSKPTYTTYYNYGYVQATDIPVTEKIISINVGTGGGGPDFGFYYGTMTAVAEDGDVWYFDQSSLTWKILVGGVDIPKAKMAEFLGSNLGTILGQDNKIYTRSSTGTVYNAYGLCGGSLPVNTWSVNSDTSNIIFLDQGFSSLRPYTTMLINTSGVAFLAGDNNYGQLGTGAGPSSCFVSPGFCK